MEKLDYAYLESERGKAAVLGYVAGLGTGACITLAIVWYVLGPF
jgi:hypothetical protein